MKENKLDISELVGNSKKKMKLNHALAYKITTDMQKCVVITSTSILANILLWNQ